jgi:hypothetical protein
MAILKNTTINDTGFLQLPVGTTAQRPSPQAGQMRFNATTGGVEIYTGGVNLWQPAAARGVRAAGGTVYDVDAEGTTYRVHVFTTTGNSTFTVTRPGTVEYLIVAGGGGGGAGRASSSWWAGGGGGAGGLITGTTSVIPQTYTVTVGTSGNGQVAGTNHQTATGVNGGNSTAFGFTAVGGGAGGSYIDANVNGRPGGSGGGAGGGAGTGGTGTVGQGNNGGTGTGGGVGQGGSGGGGGGASSVGQDSSSNKAGDGGIGVVSSITGASQFYAGGGGGGSASTYANNPGIGGVGGGGNGTTSTTGNAPLEAIGTPNSGGGGGGRGGASGITNTGGAGGSGIVVIRYPLQSEPDVAQPKVAGDGLVLDLDFAKPTVYAGSGTVVNDSRLNGITGTLVNGPVFTDARTHRSNFSFNSSSNHINLGNFSNNFISNPTLNNGRISFTLWAYTRGGFYIISSGSQTGSAGVAFSYQNGAPFASIKTTNQTASLNNFTFPINQWVFWAFTSDGSTFRGYRNGVEFNSASLSGSGDNDTQTLLVIGQPNNALSGGLHFLGELATTKFYNRALTQTEIANNFNATRWRFGV